MAPVGDSVAEAATEGRSTEGERADAEPVAVEELGGDGGKAGGRWWRSDEIRLEERGKSMGERGARRRGEGGREQGGCEG